MLTGKRVLAVEQNGHTISSLIRGEKRHTADARHTLDYVICQTLGYYDCGPTKTPSSYSADFLAKHTVS